MGEAARRLDIQTATPEVKHGPAQATPDIAAKAKAIEAVATTLKPLTRAATGRDEASSTSRVEGIPEARLAPLGSSANGKSEAPLITRARAVPPPVPADIAERSKAKQVADKSNALPEIKPPTPPTTPLDALQKGLANDNETLAKIKTVEARIAELQKFAVATKEYLAKSPIPNKQLITFVSQLEQAQIPARTVAAMRHQIDILKSEVMDRSNKAIQSGGDPMKVSGRAEMLNQVAILEQIVTAANQSPEHEKAIDEALFLATNDQKIQDLQKTIGHKDDVTANITRKTQGIESGQKALQETILTDLKAPFDAFLAKYSLKRIGAAQLNIFFNSAALPIIEKAGLDKTSTQVTLLRSINGAVAEHNQKVLDTLADNIQRELATLLETNKTKEVDDTFAYKVGALLNEAGFADNVKGKELLQRVRDDIAEHNQAIKNPVKVPDSILDDSTLTTSLTNKAETQAEAIPPDEDGVIDANKPVTQSDSLVQAPVLQPVDIPQAVVLPKGPQAKPPRLTNEQVAKTAPTLDSDLLQETAMQRMKDGLASAKSWAKELLNRNKAEKVAIPEVAEPSNIIDSFLSSHPELTLEDRLALKLVIAQNLSAKNSDKPKVLATKLAEALTRQQAIRDRLTGIARGKDFKEIDREIAKGQAAMALDLAKLTSKMKAKDRVAMLEIAQRRLMAENIQADIQQALTNKDTIVDLATLLEKVKNRLEAKKLDSEYPTIAQEITQMVLAHNAEAQKKIDKAINDQKPENIFKKLQADTNLPLPSQTVDTTRPIEKLATVLTQATPDTVLATAIQMAENTDNEVEADRLEDIQKEFTALLKRAKENADTISTEGIEFLYNKIRTLFGTERKAIADAIIGKLDTQVYAHNKAVDQLVQEEFAEEDAKPPTNPELPRSSLPLASPAPEASLAQPAPAITVHLPLASSGTSDEEESPTHHQQAAEVQDINMERAEKLAKLELNARQYIIDQPNLTWLSQLIQLAKFYRERGEPQIASQFDQVFNVSAADAESEFDNDTLLPIELEQVMNIGSQIDGLLNISTTTKAALKRNASKYVKQHNASVKTAQDKAA